MMAALLVLAEGGQVSVDVRVVFKGLFLVLTYALICGGLHDIDVTCSTTDDPMCREVLGVQRAKLGILIGHTQVAVCVIAMGEESFRP